MVSKIKIFPKKLCLRSNVGAALLMLSVLGTTGCQALHTISFEQIQNNPNNAFKEALMTTLDGRTVVYVNAKKASKALENTQGQEQRYDKLKEIIKEEAQAFGYAPTTTHEFMDAFEKTFKKEKLNKNASVESWGKEIKKGIQQDNLVATIASGEGLAIRLDATDKTLVITPSGLDLDAPATEREQEILQKTLGSLGITHLKTDDFARKMRLFTIAHETGHATDDVLASRKDRYFGTDISASLFRLFSPQRYEAEGIDSEIIGDKTGTEIFLKLGGDQNFLTDWLHIRGRSLFASSSHATFFEMAQKLRETTPDLDAPEFPAFSSDEVLREHTALMKKMPARKNLEDKDILLERVTAFRNLLKEKRYDNPIQKAILEAALSSWDYFEKVKKENPSNTLAHMMASPPPRETATQASLGQRNPHKAPGF